MSVKSKKPARQLDWVECVTCGVQLLARDSSCHDPDACRTIALNSFQGDTLLKDVKHGFVIQGIICGVLVQPKSEGNYLSL